MCMFESLHSRSHLACFMWWEALLRVVPKRRFHLLFLRYRRLLVALWGPLSDMAPILRRAVLWVAHLRCVAVMLLLGGELVLMACVQSRVGCHWWSWEEQGVELTSQNVQGTGLELRLLLENVILAPTALSPVPPCSRFYLRTCCFIWQSQWRSPANGDWPGFKL